ncbi:Hpt domain-containing protein [Cardiobacterium hominis]|uniref:Hpt domain-containing protein n=5 Tax=Cardiobacterium hominis TaxID=2718 RepID=UPI0009E5F54B|nr:Hpt domain-containing protein [Cardiobacterium hominis]
MASELGNQLLARVQDEMARNIATIKRQLIEWLERPESGGVEALREHMAEISGGLSLMGQTEAVALAEAIVAGVEALNQSVSEQGVNAAFAEKGAEIASGLLVLADYIERLDHISDNHKQSVAQATAAVKGLADGGEKIQVTTQPFISRETYQALANEVNTVIETSRNQIEQHIRNLNAPFNAENIIAQNEGLIQIFAILTLKTPQLLLQQANQMLAKDLSYAEWIEVAEALILVQETLKQLPETQTAPTANNYADAVQVQVAHSRQLEIEKLIRDTGKQGKGFFESLRKEVLQVETVKQEQPWAGAAKQLVHYSSVTALVGLKELATPLQQLGLLFAEFTAQNDATLAQTYVSVIDALVAVEYLFNDLAEAGKISVQDIAFLTEAVGKIEKICPVSGKAKALFVELANSMPTESEDDVENTGDIQEFKDALGAGLEVLADDFSVLEQEEETPEEEDLPEPTPVVLASHDTVSAAPKLAMGLAQSSAAGDNAISVRAGDDAAAPAVAPGAPASTQAATPSPAPTVQPPVVSAETAAPQSDATTATEAPTTPEAIAPQEATVPADDAALAAEEPAAAEVAPEEPAAPETHEPEAAAEDTSALEVADEASAESAVEPAAIALDEPPSAPASAPAAASTQGAPVGIAYFANKSLSDLERFDVPAEKMTFMGSHADAVMDEEIREFFNEELGEIVATMNEVYPQWRENPDDAQHTTDIRRAFHTLKGSGRTVGYEALGEFAWQHEQLLNRVIEKDFAANSLVRDTVGDAISLLNVLQAQDEFVEHKGALLQQALVAERVRLSLLDAPQSEQQALDALSRQLRLSDGAASATSATVSVAETATSAVDDEWAAFDDIALADESTSAASEAPAITLASETAEPAPEETAADMSAAPQDEAPTITLAADDFTFSDSAAEPAAHETVAPASADAVAHERQEEPASIAAPAAAASDFAGQEGYDKALRTLQRGLRMGEPDADMQAALAETIRRQWQQSVADDPALREAIAQSLLASFQNEGGTQAQWVADILAQANAAGDTAVPIQPGLTAPAAPGLPPHETPHGISEQAYNRMLSTLRRGLATGADEDMQAVLSDSISRQWLQQGIATEGETRDDIIAHLKAALVSEGAVDENVLDAMLAHVPQRVPNVLPEGVRQDSYGVMMETLRASLDNANSAEVQEMLATAIGNQWQNQNSLQDSAIRAAVAEQMAAVLGGNGHDNAALVEAVLNRAAEKARQAPAGLDKADYDQLLETLRDRIGEAQDAAAQEALAARISSQLHADNHLQDEATRDAIAQRVIAALGGAGETDAAAVEAILSRVAEKVAEQTPVPAALPVGVRPESYGAMLQTLSGGLAAAQGDEHAAEALAATIGAQWQEQHSLQDADTRAAVAQQISAALGGETDVATVEGILNRAAVQAAALPAGVKHEAYGEMLQTLRAGIGAASGDEAAAEALAATIGAQWQEQHSLQDADTRAAVAQQISAALGGETDAATVEGILNRAAVQAAALPAGVKHEAYGAMLQTLRAGIGAASGDEAAAEALAATIGTQWQEQHSLQDADTRAAVAQQISAALGGETDAVTVEGILNRAAVQAAALPAGVKHEAYGEMLQTLHAGLSAAQGDETATEELAATIGAQWAEPHSLQDPAARATVAQRISAALGGAADSATIEGILLRAAVQAANLPQGVKHEAYGEMLQTLHAELAGVQGDEAAAESLATLIAAQWEEPHSLQDSAARAAVAQQISAALGGKADVAAVEDILHRAAMQAAALPQGVQHEAYGEMLQTLRAGLAQGDSAVAQEMLATSIGAQWAESHSLYDRDTRATVAKRISDTLGDEADAATIESILNRAAEKAAGPARLPEELSPEVYNRLLGMLRRGLQEGDADTQAALAATLQRNWQQHGLPQDPAAVAAVQQHLGESLAAQGFAPQQVAQVFADAGLQTEAPAMVVKAVLSQDGDAPADAATLKAQAPAGGAEFVDVTADGDSFVDTAAEHDVVDANFVDIPSQDAGAQGEDAGGFIDTATVPGDHPDLDTAQIVDMPVSFNNTPASGKPSASVSGAISLGDLNSILAGMPRRANPAERLSQELASLAQHPGLDNAIHAEKSVENNRAGFLRAVDQFDTLSQLADKTESPELIDDLIDAVYDIEDSIDSDAAPPWVWRLLDSIEQLLLTHKQEGTPVSLSCAAVLRQSANLIENYEEEANEDDAIEVINALMNSRRELGGGKPGSTPGAMPYSGDPLGSELVEDPNANTMLAETFIDEAMSLFAHSQEEAERWDENRSQLSHLDSIRRDMHTLKGSARMAGYNAIGDLTHGVESLIDGIVNGQAEPSSKATGLLVGAMWQGMLMLDSVRDGYLPQTDPYILNNIHSYLDQPLPYPDVAEAAEAARLAQLQEAREAEQRAAEQPVVEPSVEEVPIVTDFDDNIDPVLVDIFTDEAQELLQTTSQLLEDDFSKKEVVEELQRTMHTLKGGARLVGFTAIGDTAHLMESVIDKVPELAEGKVRQAKTLLHFGLDAHYDMLDSVLRHEMPQPALEVNESLKTFADSGVYRPPSQKAGENAEPAPDSSEQPQEQPQEAQSEAPQTAPAEAPAASDTDSSAASTAPAAPATAPSASTAPAASAAAPTTDSAAHSTHAQHAESAASAAPADSPAPAAKAAEPPVAPPPAPPEKDKGFDGKPEGVESVIEYGNDQPEKKDEKKPEAKKDDKDGNADNLPRYVRVDAQLLDEMIAMTGETAIMRSRMENVISEAEFNLNELTRVATRIAEQMRRLDSETEAQMLYRREQQGEDDTHFDPLEMDRFSEIQQLSRQLSEAIDDLKNLQDTLSQDNIILRNLSTQQGIIQRGIQDHLLTTQLMRFDVHEARLRRLVKQTAKSVGKDVNFVLEGGDVEVERRLLEDILPALEHMIRNSLAHGIEKPEERLAAGKPETGTIKLVVSVHAAELSVDLIDDGQGLNYDRIREKAEAKGLLDPERAHDEAYLSTLILRSGFSTAESLSQLAGRGVGMDVVNEMVKQRRGQIGVYSLRGKGTQFTLSMPFSMSIAEVLLVEIAGQTFAAPMSSIAAISQVDRDSLQRSFDGETVYQHYNDQDYRQYILGAYFKPEQYTFAVEEQSAPVLFINAGGEPVAFHVDRILNRLEIIVKNVNRQVLNIPGISGATILGDGRVVPVLELLDLSRRIANLTPIHDEVAAAEEARIPNVLVVDDSVTMRKVSTRLLERHHYNVATAKDGLDAIEVLANFTPDIILLDIEMPRMDGFEFASHVRNSSAVSNVPIVMITSRTGDKHRERADAIGVQGYLGKPYSEEVLIQTLEHLLKKRGEL